MTSHYINGVSKLLIEDIPPIAHHSQEWWTPPYL